MSDFHVGQVAQLHEIQAARKKRCEPGIGPEVEALIRRLTDGGVAGTKRGRIFSSELTEIRAEELRKLQAKRLWDKGFGEVLGYASFEAYYIGIPLPPARRPQDLSNYFQLILVDARIFRSKQYGGLVKVCELLGVTFNGTNSTIIPYNSEYEVKDSVYWMWCQDGQVNRDKCIRTCVDQFAQSGEISLNIMEGLAIFVQNPSVIKGHYMDLPSSVRSTEPGYSVCMGLWDGEPELDWKWVDDPDSFCGSASRWIS